MIERDERNSPRFEELVANLDGLLGRHGMATLYAALAVLARRMATHWLQVNSPQNHDEWMGLYSRMRALYESKGIPASWPRPDFRWY